MLIARCLLGGDAYWRPCAIRGNTVFTFAKVAKFYLEAVAQTYFSAEVSTKVSANLGTSIL